MQLYLLLNESCNLNCDFCIRGEMTGGSLSQAEWIRVLDNNDFRKYSLLLTGGEPTIHKNLNGIIECSKDRFREICINTNGVYSDWIDVLTYRNVHVQISLDGTPAIHNMLRGGGEIDVYSQVEHTIKKLESRGISYNISTTVSKKNYEDIKKLLKQLYQYKKMRYWKVSPELPFGCGSIEDTLDISSWNDLVEWLVINSEILLCIKKLYDFSLLDKAIASERYKKLKIKSNCGDVKNKLYVYSDLTVYPCTCLTDFPLGNLRYNTIEEIIASKESDKFVHYQVKRTSSCYDCQYLNFCNGGCIGMSYNYFGELGRGDYRCPHVKK